MSDWFYTSNGAKNGPVDTEALKTLFSEGSVTYETLVWRNGFGANWKKMGDVEEFSDTNQPPPVPISAMNNTWIWTLALVPVLGYFVEKIISNSNGEVADVVILTGYFIANITLIYLDQKNVEASGRDVLSTFFAALLVPFYIFSRNKRVGANQATFLVWIAGFLLVTFGATGLTMPYLGLTTPTCSSAASIAQIKAIFPDIPINVAKIGVSKVENIKHVSQNGKLETCTASVLTTSGVSVPISYTIDDRGSEYYWQVQIGN